MDFSKLGLDEKILTDKQKQEIIKKQKEVDDVFEKLKKIPNGCKGCRYWSVMNNKCISEEQKAKGSLKKGLCE